MKIQLVPEDLLSRIAQELLPGTDPVYYTAQDKVASGQFFVRLRLTRADRVVNVWLPEDVIEDVDVNLWEAITLTLSAAARDPAIAQGGGTDGIHVYVSAPPIAFRGPCSASSLALDYTGTYREPVRAGATLRLGQALALVFCPIKQGGRNLEE